MNNKPQSMPLKDWLVSLTSSKLKMDEELCGKIISWAYEKAHKATHTNSIIELSGFGKVYAKGKKVERRLEAQKRRLQNLQEEPTSYLSEEGLIKRQALIRETQEFIEYLESKQTNETKLEGNMGGPQEQSVPTSPSEGTYQADSGGEIGDMQDMSS